MNVGVYFLELSILGAGSLKDKRRVIKSIVERVRQRYNVSISEVGEMDNWRKAEIGIAAVSADNSGTDRVMQKVFNFIDNDERVEVVNYSFHNV